MKEVKKNTEKIEVIFKEFINEFVTSNKKDRILQFLNKEKNWRKINIEFHSSTIFDKSTLKPIKTEDQYSERIYNLLKDLGASDHCYSLLDYLDNGKAECLLLEKLDDSVGFLIETIIYCPNSKIGYYEGGHAKDRYLFLKKK